PRRDWMAQSMVPALRHAARAIFLRHTKRQLVDLTRCAEHSDRNLAVVTPPLGIGHVVKQKCFSLAVGQTLILPSDRRHQFGVFLDPRSDAMEIPGFVQERNELPEIAKVGFGLLFEERPGHLLSFVRHLTNSIGLGRTTFFACSMGNSFSQNGHLAAIFSLSNWGETRNS